MLCLSCHVNSVKKQKDTKNQCSLSMILLKLYFRWQGKLRRLDIPHIERQGNRTEHNDPSKYNKLFWVENLVNPFFKKEKKSKQNTKKRRISKNAHRVI